MQSSRWRAARAVECADDQGKFDEYHETLFENFVDGDENDHSDSALILYAAALGLDGAAFDPCFQGTSKDTRIRQDISSGTGLGVTSTPTFFINNELVSGFMTAKQFGELLDRHLAGD